MLKTLAALLALSATLSAQSLVAVINRGENTVSLIDPATGAATKLPTGVGPHEALACAGRILVSNYGGPQQPGSTVSVYDAAARKPAGTVDVAPLVRPHGMVCAGDFVWFTAEVNMTVGRIRLSDLKVDQIVGTGREAGHMIVRVPATDTLYTSNISANVVTRIAKGDVTTAAAAAKVHEIDLDKLAVTRTFDTGAGPDGVAVL